ncbi:MAG: DUF1565 domain-containing protein [Chloroflexi bacterium]|nr:DUF1565 domain-containing protein [Chloroflexota bacterium]MBU1748635.1 DUF1565 domain-containing protein [Chloroflexota bacterium]
MTMRLFLPLILVAVAVVPPAQTGGDYYVRLTGNDAAGDGSSAAPWRSLTNAIAHVPAGARIRIGAGTYAEEPDFQVMSTISDLTLEPENAGDVVTITGNSSTSYATRIRRCSGWTFNRLRFTTQSNSVSSALTVIGLTTGVSGLTFNDCEFVVRSAGTAARYPVRLVPASPGGSIRNVAFNRCTMRGNDLGSGGGLQDVVGVYLVAPAPDTDTLDSITFTDCLATGNTGMWLRSGTNILVERGYVSGLNGYGILVGRADEVDARYSSGAIVGTTVELLGEVGHAMLVGHCTDDSRWTLDGVRVPRCYDHAIAVKRSTGTVVCNCYAAGGIDMAMSLKAAHDVVIEHNVFEAGAQGAFYVTGSDVDDRRTGGCQFVDNVVIAPTDRPLFALGGPLDDDGTNVIDRNVYVRGAGSPWGTVYGMAVSSATLPALWAAWAAYPRAGNDGASRVVGF